MLSILRVGDTNDLAPNQTLKVNIGICRNKIRRTDIEFICDTVKRIPCPDHIAACVSLTTVDRHIDICPRLQASRIDPGIVLQDTINADMEFSGYSAYRITLPD